MGPRKLREESIPPVEDNMMMDVDQPSLCVGSPQSTDHCRRLCFGDSIPRQFPLSSSPTLLLYILTSYGLDYQNLACLEATCSFFHQPINLDPAYSKLNIVELAVLDMCRKRASFKRMSSDQKEDLKLRCGGSWKLVLRFLMTGEACCRREQSQAIAGRGHSIVVTSSGKVYSFGNNSSGQLGHGNLQTEYKPKLISELQDIRITQVAVGAERTMLVSDLGRVYAFGKDRFADTMFEHFVNAKFVRTPQPIECLTDIIVIQVAIGHYFTAVLSVEGKVYTLCWGTNERLGHSTRLTDCVPRLLSGPLENLPVVQIGAGNCYMLALAIQPTGMSVYSLGCGLGGKLGHSTKADEKHPRLIEHFQTLNLNPVSMSVGAWHAAVLGQDGRVCTWGWGTFGCLGHGDTNCLTLPKVVEALASSKAVHVSVGTNTTFVVAEDGNVFSFGCNECSQLGIDGPDEEVLKPMVATSIKEAINGTEKIVQISANGTSVNQIAHTFILTESGKLYAFGSGQNGELGIKLNELQTNVRKKPELVNIDLS